MSVDLNRAKECFIELNTSELPKNLVDKHRWMLKNFLTMTQQQRAFLIDLFAYIYSENILNDDYIDFASSMLD